MKTTPITWLQRVLMTSVILGGIVYSGKTISAEGFQIKVSTQLKEVSNAFSSETSNYFPSSSPLTQISTLELWCLNNKIVGVIPQEDTSMIAVRNHSAESLVNYRQGPVKGIEHVVETQASCHDSALMATIQPKNMFSMKYSFANLSEDNTLSIYNFFVRQPGQLAPYSIKLLTDLVQKLKPSATASVPVPKLQQTGASPSQSTSAKATPSTEKNAVFENISAN